MATSSTPSVFSEVQRHVLDYIQWERSQAIQQIDMGYKEYRESAVLIPLFTKESELNVLLTKRSENVRSHKGEVSFPGGKSDPEDNSFINTALREAKEEINLPGEVVNIIGSLKPRKFLISPIQVHPVIATLSENFDINCLEPNDEVAEIFHVPLEFFLSTPAKDRFHTPLFEWELAEDKIVQIYGFTSVMCVQVAMIVYDRIADWVAKYPSSFHLMREYYEMKMKSKL